MKIIIRKIIILLSPFIFISLIVIIVDPYNVFGISNIFSNDAKVKCINRSNATSPRGNILWKTIEFRRNPCPNIILGDSRMEGINEEYFSKRIGGRVANLSIPAGNNKTIIDLFWMAAHQTKLKNVFVQTNFNRYNALFNYDLYQPAQQVIHNSFYYLLNWNYIEDSFAVLYYYFSKDESYINQSYKYRSDNWISTADLICTEFSKYDYVYPEKLYEGLKQIAEYCKKEHINLQFIIAPDYYESRIFIKRYNLEKEYYRFKSDISSLAPTFDLDSGLPFSYDKKNYLDYYHIRPQYIDTLITMIFDQSVQRNHLSVINP